MDIGYGRAGQRDSQSGFVVVVAAAAAAVTAAVFVLSCLRMVYPSWHLSLLVSARLIYDQCRGHKGSFSSAKTFEVVAL